VPTLTLNPGKFNFGLKRFAWAIVFTTVAIVSGCASTDTTTMARSPAAGQGTFDSRCYFAMKAIEASSSVTQFQSESQNSPFTVCTVNADGSELQFFFFDPTRRGGATLYTLSLPDLTVNRTTSP